jgi:3-phenylpropionate/trans-cinnamate dioxygenase ferredoxin reductase component
VAFPLAEILDDVTWKYGSAVVSSDLDHQSLTLASGENIAFEHLIIATGLRSRRCEFENTPAAGTHAIRSLDDAIALRKELSAGTRVIVYGAGFIGCEAAATATKLGATVTVIGKGSIPLLRPLGEQLATDVMARNEAHGVTFVMNTTVTNIVGTDRVEGVELSDGRILECDVLIEAIGSHPNTEFLVGNDIDIDSGVHVDTNLRVLRKDGTPWPHIYAIGDVARFPIPQFDPQTRRVEHWNIPTEMARRVGKLVALDAQGLSEELAAEEEKGFTPIPSFWSDQFEVSLLSYGLLDQADRSELLEGEAGGDCVYGYYKGEELVGVCGIGMRSKVMGYRNKVGLSH